MKTLGATTLLLLLVSASHAEEPATTTAPTPATSASAEATPAASSDSALVRASKAGAGRTKTSRKVITNADVKKSRGKLIPVTTKPAAPAAETKKTLFEQQDDQRRARAQADILVADAQKKVQELEKELRRIEQSYYDSNDPMYRDDVIQKSFNQTKRQLDDARKQLADARDLRGKAEPPN